VYTTHLSKVWNRKTGPLNISTFHKAPYDDSRSVICTYVASYNWQLIQTYPIEKKSHSHMESPSSSVLFKIRQDLRRDRSLLVKAAATTLSSRVPQLASELQQIRSKATPTEDVHPTQIGRQRKPCHREMEPSDLATKSALQMTYQRLNVDAYVLSQTGLEIIHESYEEE
jgi:hypothetical protein